MIPKIIHFIFLNSGGADIKEVPFLFVHFLAIKSAKLVNQCEVRLYYENPVESMWWEESKKYCDHIKCVAPTTFMGNELKHVANRTEVLRVQLLNEFGGMYLDIDTLCIKSFDPLLSHQFVMGLEVANGEPVGLCGAVMFGEANTPFGHLLLEEYRNYSPWWGQMSVKRPYKLWKENPNLVWVEPLESFFKYNWTPEGLKQIHEQVSDMSGAYLLHLWEQASFSFDYLQKITPDYVQTIDTTYTVLARKFLE